MSTASDVRDTTRATGFVRRNRVSLGIGLGIVLALLLVTWLGRGGATGDGRLDPENPGQDGARALAQVLGDHGVEVAVVRGRSEFDDARIDADTTVVVTNPNSLGAGTWDELDRRVRDASGAVLVVAGLGPFVADGLGLGPEDVVEATTDRVTEAACDPVQPLMEGLRLTTDAVAAVRGDGCFGDSAGRLLLVDRDAHRWVLTTGAPLSNADIDVDDNAAVAIRLLGQRGRVVWYVADPADTAIGDGVDLSRLLPDWLVPTAWLLGVAALALLIQRGRRLGPLVVEPVPVTIRALESTASLGRLYEKARDRSHAAALLVEGTAERLAARLGTAPTATRAELVRAVAARTGRPVARVAELLPEPADIPAHVRSDTDLVALAQDLHQLEEEVRTP
ncbi:DUF4350 domain-containing protein [Marmoricola sp. RAF53]|uniref:DUF4350 domain-containing protein n=1 Tax=Marmoricola sp. RAF53 TaxID=3233059 RepID=UPI003F97B7EB